MAGTHFGGRTLARSQALQLLFQAEATGRLVSEVLDGDFALDEGPLDDYARQLALGTDGMLHELDAVISQTSANWSVSRMPAVDRNLLRIALYEMLNVNEVDTAVAIDECVELARAYGTDESFRFVNGLLGKVARRLEAGEDVVADALAQAAAEAEASAAAEAARAEEAAQAAEEAARAAAEAEDADDDSEGYSSSGDAAQDYDDGFEPYYPDDYPYDSDLPDWV